jgi:hypothetical protein
MILGTLNTIIALVVVLLVLSLVVQSIQTALKKVFKLKSRQIEESIKDLFDQAIGNGPPATTTPADQSKLKLWWSRIWGVERQWSAEAERFKTGVLQQFKNVGRVTRWGNPVLDSLSKEDLLKVMAKLDLERFFPDYVAKLQDLLDRIKALRTAIESIASNQKLAGAASAKLSELRAIVTPLISDAQELADPQQKVKPQVVFGDLLRLTNLEVKSVLSVVSEAHEAVNTEIEKAAQATPPGDVAALEKISVALTEVANVIGDLSQKFDQAVAPLRGKRTQVETWFDTVTQSFDERYTRHMRTVSIVISIVVVMLLNANFFTIYNNISANEIQKNLIAEAGTKLLDDLKKEQGADKSGETNKPADAAQPADAAKPADEAKPDSQKTPPDKASSNQIKQEVERTKQAIQLYVNSYEQFGFAPLSAQTIESFFRSSAIIGRLWPCDNQSTSWGCTIRRDEKGVSLNKNGEPIATDCVEAGKGALCEPGWRPQQRNEWWASLKSNFTGLVGWAIMVVLLSVGAPFWQDTLESLFGIKNLLRQKSSTQNVETASGAGQTRS